MTISLISGNTAWGSGGGIFTRGNTTGTAVQVTLASDTISENKAGWNYSLGTPSWALGGAGGGFHMSEGNVNLALKGNMVIENNQASSAGGAISVYHITVPITTGSISGSAPDLTSLKIVNNKIGMVTGSIPFGGGGIYSTIPISLSAVNPIEITDNNALNGSGGGINVASATASISISGARLLNNTTKVNGGGIYSAGALAIKDATISGNKAGYDVSNNSNPWQATGDGGGVFAGNFLILSGIMTLENDTSAASGGAIYKNATSTFDASGLTSLAVSYNTARATSGGGIYTSVPLTLSNKNGGIFTYNSAGLNGGAIASTATLSLDSLSILYNKAVNVGGGVLTSASFSSKANTFAGNHAKDGGAIAGTATSTLTILNNTFSQNTATNNGGAINSTSTAAGTNFQITLSTFNGNTAGTSGQAIYLTNSTGKLLNGDIIYGNGTGNEINLASGILGNYNLYHGTTLPFSGTGNMLLGANRIQEIFTDFLPGDLASLENNGGPTQTLNILRNGLAYNYIPQSSGWLSGINNDQTGSMRIRGCNVDAGSVELQVVDPATSKWINAGNADDWNDPANWENRDSNGILITEAAIPGACTNVIIPENTTTYPVLQKAGTILAPDEAYTQAVCDTITFNFGGEVAKTNYLQYNFAKVDLKLNSGQWYTLSPVLQQQYSGDYLENGSQYRINPEISIMYYQTGNPQTGAAKVNTKFTGLFNNTDELLKMATGHAIWVDEGNRPESEFTVHFPKDSAQYCYYAVGDNQVTRISGIMARDKRGRFIYEGNASYQSNGNGTFSQTIENSNDYPQLIIGNPYMSHLDIVEFQKQNSTYLAQSFRIWKGGTSYETYLINGDGSITGTDPDYRVSPMQSVIIDTKVRFFNPLLFTPGMSVTRPGTTLRSTSQDLASDVLKVEILRQGIRQSGMAIRYQPEASRNYNKNKDVWTIIPQDFGSYVSLYSLVDGGAASIFTTGDIVTPIDLGIAVGNTIKKSINSGKTENYTIRIAPDTENQLAGKDIYLRDLKNNTTHNLTESNYNFQNTTGDVAGRVQLFTKARITSIEKDAEADNQVRINYGNGHVRVTSSSDSPVREIMAFNLLGEQLYGISNLNTSDWSFSLPAENSIVIIHVKTDKNSKTEKIIIK